jgi:hypothetical protein
MSETKTVEQWLQELPEPYRGQALENAEAYGRLHMKCSNIHQAVDGSFSWASSPQGQDYWLGFSNTIGKGGGDDVSSDPPSPWIKASDELPFAQEPVLTFKKGEGSWVQWVDEYGSWMNGTDPTHWMPLPEPPKED